MRQHINFYYKVKSDVDDEFNKSWDRGSYEKYTSLRSIARLKNLRKASFEKVTPGKKRAKYSIRDLPYDYALFMC